MSVLTLQPGKGNKVHLLLDGQYAMTVDSDFVAFSGLYDNMILNDEALTDLQGKVNARRAFNKASDLLATRDHSEKELLQKLRQKGFAAGAEEALEKLKSYGYLDDSRFALRFAQELQRVKHYGKKRIEQELFRKGVSREIVSDTLEQISFDEDALTALIERKYLRQLDTEQGVQKTIAALQRLGYSFSEIRAALQKVQEDV